MPRKNTKADRSTWRCAVCGKPMNYKPFGTQRVCSVACGEVRKAQTREVGVCVHHWLVKQIALNVNRHTCLKCGEVSDRPMQHFEGMTMLGAAG